MDFIIDNWPWLLAIVVFFVMTIIGYYAEKTGYTKKIKFKREKELPTFDVNTEDVLQNVEEFETKTVEENQAEVEFREEVSTERIAEKLIEQVSREERAPDIRDIVEEEPASVEDGYEYIEVDDDNVNVVYEVIDPNGNFNPNANPTLKVYDPNEVKVEAPAPTLIEEYDEKIKANVESKSLFGAESGYLDKENAEQLLSLIKQYENEIKPNLGDPTYTNSILADLINLSSSVTTAKTINQESAVSVTTLLDRYEDAVTPSIGNPRELARLMANVESYKKYINSKSIVSTDTSVFNLLEVYAKNIGSSIGNKNVVEQDNANKLLSIVKQYENVLKPLVKDKTVTDELLNNIVSTSDVVTTGTITEDSANELIRLLTEYENTITPVVDDKKEAKKLNSLISDYKEYISFKKAEVLGITEEVQVTNDEEPTFELPAATEEMYNLLKEYEEKIKPNIENKKIFGGTTGYIDKKYADNMLDLVTEYVNNIKPNIEGVEGDEILSTLLDYCSKVTSSTINQEQVDRIIGLIENYEEFAKKNIEEQEKLNSVLASLSDYKDYVMAMGTNSNADSSIDLATIAPEYTGDIMNLLDQYEKYIKPFILNKKLFSEDTGYIDKKYANNILDLLTEYEKDIKPLLENSEETDSILNELIELGSTMNSNELSKDLVDKINGLLDKYNTCVSNNIIDDKKLAKVNRLVEKNKGYINSMDIIGDNVDIETEEVINIPSMSEQDKFDMIFDIVKGDKEITPIETSIYVETEEAVSYDEDDYATPVVVPVVIPKKVKHVETEEAEFAPIVIPTKTKASKDMALQATKQTKKTKKKKARKPVVIETEGKTSEIIDIIKGIDVEPINVIEPVTKKDDSKLVEFVEVQEVIPVIKSKKKGNKKVETSKVDEIIEIIKSEEEVKPVTITKKKNVKEEAEFVPVKIEKVSKKNRNKKKKENKLKKEQKKQERLEKKQEELRNIVMEEAKLLDESYDMEYDMIEATDESFEE